MPTRIRLQRKGKKGRPFYHVVIADGRAPRDGKYIERIGTYNPLTTPAEVNIKEDRALYWLQVGAQPSDTVRNLLSREGILLRNHLQIGVNKGAISQAQADAKFNAWKEEKQSKLDTVAKEFETKLRKVKEELISQERKINAARAEAITKRLEEEAAAKKAEEAAKQAEAEAAKAAAEAETAKSEEPVADTAAENVVEEPIAADNDAPEKEAE